MTIILILILWKNLIFFFLNKIPKTIADTQKVSRVTQKPFEIIIAINNNDHCNIINRILRPNIGNIMKDFSVNRNINNSKNQFFFITWIINVIYPITFRFICIFQYLMCSIF